MVRTRLRLRRFSDSLRFEGIVLLLTLLSSTLLTGIFWPERAESDFQNILNHRWAELETISSKKEALKLGWSEYRLQSSARKSAKQKTVVLVGEKIEFSMRRASKTLRATLTQKEFWRGNKNSAQWIQSLRLKLPWGFLLGPSILLLNLFWLLRKVVISRRAVRDLKQVIRVEELRRKGGNADQTFKFGQKSIFDADTHRLGTKTNSTYPSADSVEVLSPTLPSIPAEKGFHSSMGSASIVSAKMVSKNFVSHAEAKNAPRELKNRSEELEAALSFLAKTQRSRTEDEFAQVIAKHFEKLDPKGAQLYWLYFDRKSEKWNVIRKSHGPGENLAPGWVAEIEALHNAPLIQIFGDHYQHFFSRLLEKEGFDLSESDKPRCRYFWIISESHPSHPAVFAFQMSKNRHLSDETWEQYEGILKAAWARFQGRRRKKVA